MKQFPCRTGGSFHIFDTFYTFQYSSSPRRLRESSYQITPCLPRSSQRRAFPIEQQASTTSFRAPPPPPFCADPTRNSYHLRASSYMNVMRIIGCHRPSPFCCASTLAHSAYCSFTTVLSPLSTTTTTMTARRASTWGSATRHRLSTKPRRTWRYWRSRTTTSRAMEAAASAATQTTATMPPKARRRCSGGLR